MANRLIWVIAVCGGLAAAAPAYADGLTAQLFPLTGEVRLLNKGAAPVPFVYSSISSPSGALDSSSAVWKSITENYDGPSGGSPGNGFIDPNGEWIKLAAESTELSEGALDMDGGSLPAFRAVSLGNIWIPHLVDFPDLAFDIQSDVETIPVSIELALDGDYSTDQTVDAGDYLVWRRFLDSMTTYFADGDLDGVVDIDDYLVWQNNFGVTLPLPPYGASTGGGSSVPPVAGGVPEPAGAILLMLAAGFLTVIARRGRRA